MIRGYSTPKHHFMNNSQKFDSISFQSSTNNINNNNNINPNMRRTDYSTISNKKVFSLSRGLGPYNIGSQEWVKGKEK